MKTFVPKKDDIDKKWWLVNAEGKILGRLATEVATLLRGKNKPTFAAFVDTGDFVIVINAEKIAVTGRKLAQKEYYAHRCPEGPPGEQAGRGHQESRVGDDPEE
jgi:large subunit ribosomal protein L13